ncbi:MAG TPA: helix-hairpin-helix domain-containing protein [Candidatus Limnocylindria bacterium]|nr:helix-hairpin-helix domain-containing protein [Candidatus Limnocylindria bacterium]
MLIALTPAERRAALLIVLLLLIGTGYDLWRLSEPPLREPPSRLGVAAAVLPDTVPGTTAPPAPRVERGLDLNRASERELESLPGIGRVLAARIVEHRLRHGPFTTPEELLGVRGIGPRLFARLRDQVHVTPP